MRSGPGIVSNIAPKLFGITGFVAVGYVLFAFLLGVTLGTVIGRPGWAFATGLPIFGGVRLLVDGLRPTLVSPAFAVSPAQPFSGPQPNGWVLNAAYLPTGRTTPAPGQTCASSWDRVGSCFDQAQSQAGVDRCAAVAHLHYVTEYQPESHFWMLQGVEGTSRLRGAGAVPGSGDGGRHPSVADLSHRGRASGRPCTSRPGAESAGPKRLRTHCLDLHGRRFVTTVGATLQMRS